MKTRNEFYVPPDPNLWQGRTDALPFEQLYQHVQPISLDCLTTSNVQCGFAIVGFCCDEGIRRNQGRPGAFEGPQAIRKMLGKLATHFFHPLSLFDVGNIVCTDHRLEEAQQALGTVVAQLLKHHLLPIVLGGGHETAWGHYQGLSTHATASLGIINIDAHFDLRALTKDFKGHSGTPFLQIAEHCKTQGIPFDYFCIGIQKHANTQSLFETAKRWNVNYLQADDLILKPLESAATLDKFLAAHHNIYLSICLDVFGIAFAPGVSAPQALGLTPWQLLPLLQKISQSGKVIAIDLVEVSPPLDHDNKTAMLAASLLMSYLQTISLLPDIATATRKPFPEQ